MNKRIKAGWIKKLRSGKFKQCRQKLRKTDGPGQVSYCCLGVLTAMAVKNGVCPARMAYKENVLHISVSVWAGLGDNDPDVGNYTASGLNDTQHKSFAEIANLIEENL